MSILEYQFVWLSRCYLISSTYYQCAFHFMVMFSLIDAPFKNLVRSVQRKDGPSINGHTICSMSQKNRFMKFIKKLIRLTLRAFIYHSTRMDKLLLNCNVK